MAKTKYQVFISSTFRDLAEERQGVTKAILDLEHIPAGMELFPAADLGQFEYIKKVIDECDYYVLIIGARYGSIDEEGISFTEREYDYSVSAGKYVLAFIHSNPDNIAVAKAEMEPARRDKLDQFRAKVAQGRLVKSWDTREDLWAKVIVSLTHAISQHPGVGWVRGDTAASADLLAQINALRDENDKLRSRERSLTDQKKNLTNLAGLDDEVVLRYVFPEKLYGGGYIRKIELLKLTWGEIFKAVGPHLIQPRSAGMLKGHITQFAKENKVLRSEVPDFLETDINTIKVHLIALGLISAHAAEKVGGGVAEFIELTEQGKARLIDVMAIRKPPVNPLSPGSPPQPVEGLLSLLEQVAKNQEG